MDFNTKIEILEQARKDYPEFDAEFLELLGAGYSFAGAYDYFSVDHADKYKKVETKVAASTTASAAPKKAATNTEPVADSKATTEK